MSMENIPAEEVELVDDTQPIDGEVTDLFEVEEPEFDETIVVGGEILSDDESEEASDDAAVATEGDSTPEATAEGSAEAPPEPAAEAATQAQVDTPVTPDPEPLRFKADGREFTVAGRRDAEGNFVIAAEEWQRVVQPRLADRGAWQQERESYRRQIAALDPQKHPEVVRARKLTEQFQALLDSGPDAVVEWAEKYDANKDVLMARAEAAAARAQAENAQGILTEQERSRQVQELESQLSSAVDSLLEKATEVEDYRDLDMGYVRELLTPVWSSIFFRAPHDMPEFGISEGEIGVNVEVVDKILRAEANRTAAFRQQQAAATAASEAAKRNAAVLNRSTPATPPPVVATKAAPGQGGAPRERPKSLEEWESRLSAIAAGRA